MILFYSESVGNGIISRVRMNFDDLPGLQALAAVKSKADVMENEQKILAAAVPVLLARPKHNNPNCKGDSFLVSDERGRFRHCSGPGCGTLKLTDTEPQYSVLTYQGDKVWLTIE